MKHEGWSWSSSSHRQGWWLFIKLMINWISWLGGFASSWLVNGWGQRGPIRPWPSPHLEVLTWASWQTSSDLSVTQVTKLKVDKRTQLCLNAIRCHSACTSGIITSSGGAVMGALTVWSGFTVNLWHLKHSQAGLVLNAQALCGHFIWSSLIFCVWPTWQDKIRLFFFCCFLMDSWTHRSESIRWRCFWSEVFCKAWLIFLFR